MHTLENHLDIRHECDSGPVTAWEWGHGPRRALTSRLWGAARASVLTASRRGRKQTAAKRPPNRWRGVTQRGPASCRTTLTLTEAPLLVRLVVVGGGTPESAVLPPVRGARVVFLVQEEEREVAWLPVRCALNGGQSWKGKAKMGTRAAPAIWGLDTVDFGSENPETQTRGL